MGGDGHIVNCGRDREGIQLEVRRHSVLKIISVQFSPNSLFRCKDRSQTHASSLSFEESARFRRALYLNWLLYILAYSEND